MPGQYGGKQGAPRTRFLPRPDRFLPLVARRATLSPKGTSVNSTGRKPCENRAPSPPKPQRGDRTKPRAPPQDLGIPIPPRTLEHTAR